MKFFIESIKYFVLIGSLEYKFEEEGQNTYYKG